MPAINQYPQLKAADGSDNVNFTQAGSNPATRSVQDKLRDMVSVKDFGAVGNGIADDTIAIQAAIDSFPNGGTVFFPPGVYAISNTLNLTKSGVRLIGSGRDAQHTFTPPVGHYNNTAKTTSLLWVGAVGGTMIKIEPPITSPASVGGNAVLALNLLSSVFPHTNAAAIGVSVKAAVSGEYDFFGLEFSQAALYMGARSVDPSSNETSTTFNTIKYLGSRNFSTNGGALRADGVDLKGNVYNNLFEVIDAVHLNGTAIDLYSSDNNIFLQTRITRASGGTGVGVYLRSGATLDTPARANIFMLLSPGGGGVIADASLAFPSYENKILFYNPDENSSPSYPIIQAGATLFYETTKKSGACNFRARMGTNQVITPSTSWTKVNFSSIVDPAGWFDNTNSRWVPRYPGTYNLSVSLFVKPASDISGQVLQLRIVDHLGNSIGRSNIVFPTGTGTISCSLNALADIPNNGYVEVNVLQNTSANITIETAFDDGTYWYGSRAY